MTDLAAASAELHNPATTPARLQELAAAFPQLQASIAQHPNVYPGLLDWIAAYGDAQAQAAVRAVRAPAGPPPAGPPHAAAPSPAAPPLTGAPVVVVPQPVPRKRRLGAVAIVGITAGAVVLAGGGVAAAVVLPGMLPASSPSGAVQRVIGAAASFDLLGLATAIAPSESELFASSFQDASSITLDGIRGEDWSPAATLQQLRDSVTLTVEGAEWDEESIVAGEVVRMTMTEGRIVLDTENVDAVVSVIVDAQAPALRLQLQGYGYSDAEIEEQLGYLTESVADGLDFPYVVDARELLEDSGGTSGIRMVTVREGSGWYVSPLLSSADLLALGSAGWGGAPRELGTEIPAPVVAGAPADAFAATLDAALDQRAGVRSYWRNLAATLPLAERRLVAIYGPAIGDGQSPFAMAPSDFSIEVEHAGFDDVTVEGSRALLRDAQIRVHVFDGWADFDYRVEGTCVSFASSYSSGTDEACLSDLEDVMPFSLEEIGLDDIALVAVNQSGGWQFSPLGTVTDLQSKVTEAIVKLSNEGKLDRLFG